MSVGFLSQESAETALKLGVSQLLALDAGVLVLGMQRPVLLRVVLEDSSVRQLAIIGARSLGERFRHDGVGV